MSRTRTLVPYLWAVAILVGAWYMARTVGTDQELARNADGVILLGILLGYSITLVACSRRRFAAHQLGHALAFVAAVFLGVLLSGMERDILMIYFSLALAFWASVIAAVGALVLLLTRWIVAQRPASER